MKYSLYSSLGGKRYYKVEGKNGLFTEEQLKEMLKKEAEPKEEKVEAPKEIKLEVLSSEKAEKPKRKRRKNKKE